MASHSLFRYGVIKNGPNESINRRPMVVVNRPSMSALSYHIATRGYKMVADPNMVYYTAGVQLDMNDRGP